MNKQSVQDMVLEFHKVYKMRIGEKPEIDIPSKTMRLSLILEEVKEYVEALSEGDLVEVADALADLVYVTYGAAIEHGINLDEVIEEVHRSNLSKLHHETNEPIYREDGKVLKGENYSAPNVEKVLKNQNSLKN